MSNSPDRLNTLDNEADLPEPPERACANCGSALNGHYCAICGQANTEVKRPIWSLIKDLLHIVLDLDGRAYHSLFLLFTRPAYLSRAYISGQRARFTPPLRLFLAISILFFVVVSAENGLQRLTSAMRDLQAQQTQVENTESQQDTNVAGGRLAAEFDEQDLEEIYGLIERINLPLLSDQANANLHLVMRDQAENNYRALVEDPREALQNLLQYITVFMLVLMPLLALIQAIAYFPARRYYIEHLVLTVHNTAFVILVFLLQTLVGLVTALNVPVLSAAADWLSTLSMIWIVVYLYLSQKFFFGWGWWLTGFLFLLTSLAYSIIFSTGIALFGLVLFLLF